MARAPLATLLVKVEETILRVHPREIDHGDAAPLTVMEFVTFKIKALEKDSFDNVLTNIFREYNINCYQRQYDPTEDNYYIASVPKYCIDQIPPEQLDALGIFEV